MAQTGDINLEIGVYKSGCCDQEIAIGQGVAFPVCRIHKTHTTVWTRVPDGKKNGLHFSPAAAAVLMRHLRSRPPW
jgi:hypothetical protein